MKIAQSFQYRGIPVALAIDPLIETGTININSTKKVYRKCSDVDLLRRVAENLVDQEIDGDLYNYSTRLRDNVSL